jgi:hypothetical protein
MAGRSFGYCYNGLYYSQMVQINKRKKMKQIIQKNYVLISALISALSLVLTDAMKTGATDWKAMGFAALVAILGAIANSWKAKGLTVTGLIGSVSGAIVTILNDGYTTWNEIILASLVAIITTASSGLSAFAPKNKSSNYPTYGKR